MSFEVHTEIAALRQLLDEVEGVLEWPDARRYAVAGEVSGWSAGQQVEHVLAAMRGTLAATRRLVHGSSADRAEPNPLAESSRRVLESGRIPRGSTRAPDGLTPIGAPVATLRDSVRKQRLQLDEIEARASAVPLAAGTFPHPALGELDALQWLRFTRVHTQHHLEIIHDIVTAFVRGR